MAGTHFSVEVRPGHADEELQRLDTSLSNTAPLLAMVGEYLQGSVEGRFRAQRGPDGSAWQALSPRYQRRKKRNKDKILTLNGYLRSYIRWQPDSDDAVLVGTDRKYGAIHQFGGTIKQPARQSTVHFGAGKAKHLFVKKSRAKRSQQVSIGAHEIKMPARPYLGISEEDEKQIQLRVLDWLNDR
ncbi:virion morphogenesis protein [Delftia tsuruhatensis]|nr:virion morphogenesis protein [Delftia tsuruhatensis]